jgi:hypothetical protein
MSIEKLINFEIFILTFLKIQYFPSQFFKIWNPIFEILDS